MKPLKTNRSYLVIFLLTIITFGIYGMYFIHERAASVNIALKHDGKKTGGLLAFILLNIITLGLYSIYYSIVLIARLEKGLEYYKSDYKKYSLVSCLLWHFLGALIIIGPIVAKVKTVKAVNYVCIGYNNANKLK